MTQTLLLEINNAVSGLEYDWCMTETKVCARCKRELPRDEFTAQPRMKSGLKSYCRKCCGDHARELYGTLATNLSTRPRRGGRTISGLNTASLGRSTTNS